MTPEVRTAVEEQYRALKELRLTGAMDVNIFYKCVVCLASECFTGDDVNMGLYLLNQCHPEYFKTVQAQQMQDDRQYAEVVIELAAAVMRLGIVDLARGPVPTQSPGTA